MADCPVLLEIVRCNLLLVPALLALAPGAGRTAFVASASAQLAAGSAPIGVTIAARALQPGELVVLTLTGRADADRVRVGAFGRPIPVAAIGPGTWRALIGLDLDVAPGHYPVAITMRMGDDDVERAYDLAITARRFATRKLEVDDLFVNPPASAMPRIEREAAELERVWNETAVEPLWTGRFVAPVSEPATSSFGTRSIFNGKPRSPHSGTDFLSPAGTPIKAPNAGRVALADDLYFSGNTLVIDHGAGLVSLVAHLSAFAVHEGEIVSGGQVVGNVGATGRVTGPHLHWAVRVNGARVDPLAVLAVLGK